MTRNRLLLVATATALVFGVAGWLYFTCPGLHLYNTFESPDGQYRVEVWRQPLPLAMPGQSGDAPGSVRLVDATGELLAEVPVEMVQLVDEVDWSEGHAYIRLIVDWELSALP